MHCKTSLQRVLVIHGKDYLTTEQESLTTKARRHKDGFAILDCIPVRWKDGKSAVLSYRPFRLTGNKKAALLQQNSFKI
jgi:hypothetical protein